MAGWLTHDGSALSGTLRAMHQTWQRGDYEISTDPARIDLAVTHRFLSEEAYWSPGVPREIVERAIGNSIVFGIYKGSAQAGLARVVSDRATFAWICDVFVLPEHRGTGSASGSWNASPRTRRSTAARRTLARALQGLPLAAESLTLTPESLTLTQVSGNPAIRLADDG